MGSKDQGCLGASHLLNMLNSVLRIRPHLASPLFNCGHNFAASSQTISALPKSSHNSSHQLFFSSCITSAQLFQLFSATLTSAHRFSTFLNPSQLLFSPLATSSKLFPPLLISSHLFLSSFHLFQQRNFYTQTLLHTGASAKRRFYTEEAFTIFSREKLLHTKAFSQSKV